MPKLSKPHSEEEVFEVMKDYSEKKGYSFTDTQLRFMAENCFLFWEGRNWDKVAYWPAVCMRWVLNERGKFKGTSGKGVSTYKKPKSQGKSVRDKIMERENTEQENDKY